MPVGPTTATASAEPLELVALASRVAQQAADLLLEGSRKARSSVGTKSSATDMVTEMDRASEDLIVTELLAARPDDGIVAEEGSARTGTSGVHWVIDPLDGTTNYIYGHPGWAVSIAAEADSGLLAGVVVDVMAGQLYSAALGHGASRDGEPIACSDLTDISQALVATGFAYQPERRRAQAEVLVDLLPQIRDIRRMGAAAVDLCSVACGRVDAYFERGLSPWDWAAGTLIAREAGAVVQPFEEPVDRTGDSLLAAPPALAEQLRAHLCNVCTHKGS